MFGLPCALRGWIIGLLVTSALALWGARGSAAPAASPYAFIPLDAPAVVSIDLPWVWKSADIIPDHDGAGNLLRAAEESLGLSFEKDILPWAGQAAFVPIDLDNAGAKWALLVQIRDADRMVDGARLETLLQSVLADRAPASWLSLDYKGTHIRRTVITRDGSVKMIATAVLDGWLVITRGDGVIRKVIDTKHGDSPSLATHPAFARAMGGLPADAVGQFCLNGQGLIPQKEKTGAGKGPGVKDLDTNQLFIAGAITCPDHALQFDLICPMASPAAQARLKLLRARVGTVSGASLAHMPAGAATTVLIPNPDQWVGMAEQMIINAIPESSTRMMIRLFTGVLGGVREVLQHCTGELGIACYNGKEPGVVFAGDTGSSDAATVAALDLESLMKDLDKSATVQNGLYILPPVKEKNNGIFSLFSSIQLSWMAKQQWVLASSNPQWITQPAATPPMALPEAARGAQLAAFGDYSLLFWMEQSLDADSELRIMLAKLTPDHGQWVFTLKVDEDGSALRCHLSSGVPVTAAMIANMYLAYAGTREKAQQTTSMNRLRQLATAASMYMQEHDEQLPVINTTADIKRKLHVDDSLLISPRTHEPYTFNSGLSGKSLGEIPDTTISIIFYEKTPARDGSRCVAFLDEHVALIKGDAWASAKKRAKIP